MPRDLESVFAELGISQYLESFIDNGFDTWDTILDITESDLDQLGVKLGHRRKLQRRIANARGHAPSASLVSTKAGSGTDEPKVENPKLDQVRADGKDVAIVTKRKYRRHPKTDTNAPERPPSAYVLFSNKMRDDLKGRNLTFTEIAKLVGENWQSLSPDEKEPYEKEAQTAKEKYNRDLVEYKKTPEYREYMQYLHEFKKKQASQNQAKDVSKRLKLESGSRLHHHGSSTSGTPRSGSATGSGSDQGAGHDGPLPRQQRLGSATSVPDTRFSPNALSHHHSMDETMHSPASTHFDRDDTSPIMQHASPNGRSRRPTWGDGQMSHPEAIGQQPLPSLSDVFSGDRMTGITRTSPVGVPGMPGPFHGPPHLKHEPSAGSMGSSSSSYSRTPSEASLPIHALLSGKSSAAPGYGSPPPPFFGQPGPDARLPYPSISSGPTPSNGTNGTGFSPPKLTRYASTTSSGVTDGSVGSTPSSRTSVSVHDSVAGPNGKSETSLDGMNALLRAGEIVGRRH